MHPLSKFAPWVLIAVIAGGLALVIVSTILIRMLVTPRSPRVTTQPQAPPAQQVYLPSPPPRAASQPDPTSDWKTYRNEEYGFEFKYPDSFYVESTLPGDRRIVVIGPKSPSPFRGRENLSVDVIIPTRPLALVEFAQKVIELSSHSNTFQASEQRTDTFAGREAYIIAFTGGIHYDPFLGSREYFYEAMELVYLRHDPYILALFIPRRVSLFKDIAETLTLIE